jgi:hypothetical protein
MNIFHSFVYKTDQHICIYQSIKTNFKTHLMKTRFFGFVLLAFSAALILASCKKDDSNNNSGSPVVTLTGSAAIVLNLGDTYTDAGATATDSEDGTLTVSTSGSVNTNQVNDYTITYTATDTDGNAGTATRSVKVTAQKLAGNYSCDYQYGYNSTATYSGSNFNKLTLSRFGVRKSNVVATISGSAITIPQVTYDTLVSGTTFHYRLYNITGIYEKAGSIFRIKQFTFNEEISALGYVMGDHVMTDVWTKQ